MHAYPIFKMPRPFDFTIFHYLNVNNQDFKFLTNNSAGFNSGEHGKFRETTWKISYSGTEFAQYNHFVTTDIGVTTKYNLQYILLFYFVMLQITNYLQNKVCSLSNLEVGNIVPQKFNRLFRPSAPGPHLGPLQVGLRGFGRLPQSS